MAINEVKLQNLEPKDKVYQEADGGGLFVEVLTDGTKFWRLRYQLADKEKVTLGKYPTYSLTEARQWRTDCRELINLGISPRALKRGELTLNEVKPEAKELADAFLNNWCWATVEKNKAKNAEAGEVKEIEDEDTLEAFAQRMDAEIAELSKSKPSNEQEQDITSSSIDTDALADIDADDDQMAPQNSGVLKRLLTYVRKKK